jgi:pimeloyl-ACP methyl ester carboxylesterase
MPKHEWQSLYPFESKYLDLGDARIHYVDEGPRDACETLVLVHGNPTWSFYWREVIQAFRDQYRIVAIDHLGCGLSDKPQDAPYTLAQHVANLTTLIEKLDLQNITLVGHDWGGAIGMGAAQNVSPRIARIAMLNTAAFRAPKIPLRIRVCRTPLLGPLAVRGCNAFSGAALRMATARPKQLTAQVKAGYLAPYDSWANRVAVQRFVEDIPISTKHPSFETLLNIENRLPMFHDRPIALIWGMRDWCFSPWFLDKFREFFPEAAVHAIDDAGHWVVDDATEQVIAALEQLLAQPSPTKPATSPAETAAGTL